jgi:hypothetical protein
MKTYCIALIAAAGSMIAAEVPRELVFKSTTLDAPPLKLSEAPTDRPACFPFAQADLIAPAVVREKIIRDFQFLQSNAESGANKKSRKASAVCPMSPYDLIGPSSDREKVTLPSPKGGRASWVSVGPVSRRSRVLRRVEQVHEQEVPGFPDLRVAWF